MPAAKQTKVETEERTTFEWEIDGVTYAIPRFGTEAEPLLIFMDETTSEVARMSQVVRGYLRDVEPKFYAALVRKPFEDLSKFFEAWVDDSDISPLD